jgi:hypothetical protein
MKRRVVWLLALAGLIWLFRRRLARPQPVGHVPPPEDPADDLRRKLGEARSQADAGPEPAGANLGGETVDEIEERRESVHEHARAAADEMRRSAED